MVGIAVLGFGTVGSGVVEVIRRNGEGIREKAGKKIEVRKILDIRNFEGHPEQGLITGDPEAVFGDQAVSIIVETIGGVGAAYELTKRALMSGRSVVTSNKELVSLKGPELIELARENKVSYLFEASVGGGIPIIRPLTQCLAANEVYEITGILNGTTNYILTSMKKDGITFNDALEKARENGYTEADPSADIEGTDACRKISILASIAFNRYLPPEDIYTEGISAISREDLEFAGRAGCVVKLIASAYRKRRCNGEPAFGFREKGAISARVCPVMFQAGHPLANVDDVFNAILVKGDITGEVMFYGKGAGKYPTASAVAADIIDIVKHGGKVISNTWSMGSPDDLANREDVSTRLYIRVRADDACKKSISGIFGNVDFIPVDKDGADGEIAFITPFGREGALFAQAEMLKKADGGIPVLGVIRFGL